jgi:uncharacterized protein YgiM (DUF1202 family)
MFGLLATPAWAATGSMIRNDQLRAAPSASAASVGQLAKGSPVEIVAKQSGWTQVKSGGKTGWVRILSVRVAATDSADLGGLMEAGSKRDPGKAVAVAGVRGLSEEELKGAHYSPEQVALLDQYKVDKAAAEQFGQSGGLVVRPVAHLPDVQAEARKTKSKSNDSKPGEGFSLLGE